MKRIALVTGAGSGIGMASARALCRAGYATVFTGRRSDALEAAVKGIDGAVAIPADVTRPEAVDRLFADIKARYGRLDVLFNNAGTSAPSVPLEDLTFAQWQSVVDVNLTGMFLCLQGAFRIMKAQNPMGGRIINNGSISAHAPRPDAIPYNATKYAVTGLTKSGSLDGRKYDIAVGQIDIGNAATNMTERMTKGVKQANGTLAVEPTFDVEEVANMVVHMAGLPLSANVQFVTIMATKMPFIGRG